MNDTDSNSKRSMLRSKDHFPTRSVLVSLLSFSESNDVYVSPSTEWFESLNKYSHENILMCDK
jgi:hypothetical protein